MCWGFEAMSEKPTAEDPQGRRRYMEWPAATPEEIALSRKLFFGMMAALAILLGALVYGALK